MVNIKKNWKAYFGLIFLLQYEEMWKKKSTTSTKLPQNFWSQCQMSPAVLNEAKFGKRWSRYAIFLAADETVPYFQAVSFVTEGLICCLNPHLLRWQETHRAVTLTHCLWSCWRVDAAKISKCMACDLSSFCVSLSHSSCALLSVSSSQAPAMALYWSITWPVAFSTKNSVSTLVKSGKVFVFCVQHFQSQQFSSPRWTRVTLTVPFERDICRVTR